MATAQEAKLIKCQGVGLNNGFAGEARNNFYFFVAIAC